MKIITTVKEMQTEAEKLRRRGKIIGLVPTMGYLHEGHLSLIRIARKKADVVVISIFVNPTQFGPNEDLDKYPRDIKRDEKLASETGVDIIFYPSNEEMYPERYLTYVTVEKITETLCGTSRPGHFRGVTTICAKLFNIVKPHFAVFGEKDYQQAAVIKQMLRDLNLDMKIITGTIVREADGLAISSRNAHLSPEERQDALVLNRSLKFAEEMIQNGEKRAEAIIKTVKKMIEEKKSTRVDYVSVVDPDTLASLEKIEDKALIALAVFVGDTRLIDNRIVKV